MFSTYGRMYEQLNPWFRTRFPKQPEDTDFVYNRDDPGQDVSQARQDSWRYTKSV